MNVSKHAFLSPPPISLSPMHVHVHEQINTKSKSIYKAKIKEKDFPFTKAAGIFVKKVFKIGFKTMHLHIIDMISSTPSFSSTENLFKNL